MTWAAEVSRPELDEAPFPAYTLDCAHRLVVWNRLVPPLFGIDPRDPTLGGLAGQSIMVAWFDEASPISGLVLEPRSFLVGLVRGLQYEMQQFRTEAWYEPLLDRLRELPGFREAWETAAREQGVVTAARALVPILLNVPKVGPLRFRLSSERFVRDARFRVVYLFPGDPAAMSACASWAAAASPPAASRPTSSPGLPSGRRSGGSA